MVNLLASLGGSILVLVAGAIFLLMFAIILEVLRETSFFKGGISFAVALCVSVLSLAGLWRFLLQSGEGRELPGKGGGSGIGFDLILLSYAALAIAMLVMSLLLSLNRVFRKRSKKRHYREFYRGKERHYPFSRTNELAKKSDGNNRIRK